MVLGFNDTGSGVDGRQLPWVWTRRLRRTRWLIPCVTVVTLACAHGPHARTVRLHGEIDDASGDAVTVPDVSRAPDLILGVVDVRGGNATFTVRLAPGSFDRATTRLTIQLDTDQRDTTGIRTPDGLGIDYVVDAWSATGTATILTADPTGRCTAGSPCYQETGTAALTLLADGMRVTVALAQLGHANGRFNFRVQTYAMRLGMPSSSPTVVADVMPDAGLGFATARQ